MLEAVVLVVLVVILFLQTWRAAVIPIVAIPISLIGTFFVMSVVRLLAQQSVAVRPGAGHRHRGRRRHRRGRERRAQHRRRPEPRAAARKTMDEVGTALVAIALVLCAVFIPSMFITGISGQFYRQFALTIASATVISLIISLTLSPAMCALLLKPHDPRHRESWLEKPIHGFFRLFNRGFDGVARGYSWLVRQGGAHLGGDADRLCGDHRRRPQLRSPTRRRLHSAAGPRLPRSSPRSCRRAPRWRAPTR